MAKKELVCVSCPIGCSITVELSDSGEVLSVTGNTCKRGDAYARAECTHPERMVTSTVKVEVKTSSPIPKEKIFECMTEINKVTLKAPVSIGDVVIEDVLGTGVNIVATNND